MRILLTSSNTASHPYPVFPLGCAVVAKALKAAGHEVEIFDVMAETGGDPSLENIGKALEMLAERLRAFSPGMVGISIRNIDNVNILEEETFLDIPKRMVEVAWSVLPRVPVVLGGSGFSIMPETMLERLGADYGVAGEGEHAVVELAAEIAAGKRPPKGVRKSPPLGGDEGDGWRIVGAEYPGDLLGFYTSKGSVAPVQTKRGCPNHCVYCSYPFLEGRAIRCRPPSEVVDEMRFLREERGADFVFFTDSVFNDAEGTYWRVVEEMERKSPEVPWTAFFQPSKEITPDIVERLSAAGLHSVELGVDAAADKSLKEMGKGFSFDLAKRCNDIFTDAGIAVANYFMMGGPGETRETIEEGINNIASLERAVSFVFLGVRILPGTPLLKLAIEQGVVTPDTDFTSPVYYFSPELDRKWLEQRLDETLARMKRCVYPPNSMDAGIALLRRMGYRGNLWEMMLPGNNKAPVTDGNTKPEMRNPKY